MRKVGYCVGKAFFRGSLVCRDTASIDNCVNILFDDFRKMCLVFGRMGGFYAGHYKSPENNIVEQYYTFSFRTKSRPTVCGLPHVLFVGYLHVGGRGFCLGAGKT